MEKNFKLKADEIVELIPAMGAGLATDHITVDGMIVGYMYREQPDEDWDTGWRFFSGFESQEYVDEPNNSAFYNINTIANYDRAIIDYLTLPVGTELERIKHTAQFEIVSGQENGA